MGDRMRLLPLFLCAVLSLCMANMESLEGANLEETTELTHGHADLHSAAKVAADTHTSAKVGVKAKVSSKGKAASALDTRATVMIGTTEFDSEEVSLAKTQLRKVVSKIGTRHPAFLGETVQVSTLVDQGTTTGYVAGGYLRLKKILEKVDSFEAELTLEHRTKDNERTALIRKCNKDAADLAAGMEKFDQDSIDRKNSQKQKQDLITTKMGEIEQSRARELGEGMEITMHKTLKDTKTSYDAYWTETEERHQVRNVLMQALWLVCVGFRKFRHTEYCTTLRKQPDFQEGGDSKWVDEGGNDYDNNVKNSIKFAETMTPVWEQQKSADEEAANQLDGDVDMEKGFVNNRAPWGVDPASSGGEKEKEMTAEQMSSRLSFLIETSYTPERVSGPITGFISALQEGDEASQQSLVQALVDIDRQEGEAQSALDAEWYADMVAGIDVTTKCTDSQFTERKTQGDLHKDITSLHAQMVAAQKQYEELEAIKENTVAEGHEAKAKCGYDLVEVEATLFVNEEELVNIMRLNSLLRFLVIGEKAKCSDCKDENRGSCTWLTRGAEPVGAQAEAEAKTKGCVNLQNENVKCNYAYSGREKFATARMGVFCACEYGFYGSTDDAKSPNGVYVSQICNKIKCPGYGRILYPAYQEGSALAVHSDYPAIAVCSSRHGETQGMCTDCFRDGVPGSSKLIKTPKNIETAQMTESFPYHGKNRKCEHWMCPEKEVSTGSDTFYYKPAINTKVCMQHGICVHDKYGYSTGRCACTEPWYGHACHLRKCQAREGVYFPATSPNACNCNAGGISCGRTENEQCPTGCAFLGCSKECGNAGRCDRITGKCVCDKDVLLNGPTCNKPKRCNEREADWSQSFDKWGCSTCKHGWLLVGLKTDQAGSADALYNLNKAVCAQPCEGDHKGQITIEKYACYHENWWKKFDTAGGKYCRRNYFVAGLFRSHCNSLYCLEMAKCCQVLKSLWTACEWSKETGWTGRDNGIRAGNADGFVVGFWRDGKHTLNGITQLRICTPIWWGLFGQQDTRGGKYGD